MILNANQESKEKQKGPYEKKKESNTPMDQKYTVIAKGKVFIVSSTKEILFI
jgi:hypothetical protein